MDPRTPGQNMQARDANIASQAPNSKPGLPAEVRAIGAALALDILVGVWLALHTRGAITAYLAPQLPAIGIGAVCWGFLPDEPKKAFSLWLSRHLATPTVYWSIILSGTIGLVTSLFISTIIVESVDPSLSTSVHIVRGTELESTQTKIESADRLRLNRLTTPQRKHLWIPPLGQRVWAYTPTHVSVASPRVIPWVPSILQYPDDFEPMATLDLLPGDTILPLLSRGDIRITIWLGDDERRIVAKGLLHEGSTQVAFLEPDELSRETIEKWRQILEALEPDPGFVQPMLGAWQNTQWLPSRYPLRVNDNINYELGAADGDILTQGQLTLTDVTTLLDISF